MNGGAMVGLAMVAILLGMLGCTGSSPASPTPPSYTVDLQPGDGTIPPSGVAIFYLATLRENGQPVAYPATPQWSFVDAPSYSVGTLMPVTGNGTPDPAKKSCYYQPPGELPQGVNQVSFKVRVQVQVGSQIIEASRHLTLDKNAVQPPLAAPGEGSGMLAEAATPGQ